MTKAKAKRKGIPTSTRFEVFKRDSFTCQYCGRKAPEVVLELEHINPVSKGGDNELLNLITSCWACNSGKSDKTLDDATVIAKQHAQLEELQARREQIEMMLRWRDGNRELDTHETRVFCDQFMKVTGWTINETGASTIRAKIKKHGLERMLEALDHAVLIKPAPYATDSIEALMNLMFVLAEPDDIQRLYKLRARIRRRWNYVHDGICIGLLKQMRSTGLSIDEIEDLCAEWMAESGTGFTWWRGKAEQRIREAREERAVARG